MNKYQIIDVFSASPYNFKGSFLLCEIECENINQAKEYVKLNYPIHYQWGDYGYYIKQINHERNKTNFRN